MRTEFVLAIDADTTLEDDAIERLQAAFEDPEVAAACGFVLPRHVRTLWERGRYVEYLFAFTFFKPIQDYYGAPLISSGCFSLYRVDALRALGGWSTRTLAEDMDLTWSFYQAGWKVRFVPEAMSYPIEPYDLRLMRIQLKRWSHGFVQNVRLQWRGLLDRGFLSFAVAVACWDALVSSLAYLVLIPALALIVSPWFLLAYVLDVPAVIVPLAATALRGRELERAVASLPALYVTVVYSGVKLLFPDTPQPQLDATGTAVETTSQPVVDAASLKLLPIAPVVMTIGTLALLLAVTLLVGLAARRRSARDEHGAAPGIEPGDVPPAVEPSPALAA